MLDTTSTPTWHQLPRPMQMTLPSKDQVGCQILINSVEDFLAWTRTMKAKPAKCGAHAMKNFIPDKKMRQEGHKTQYGT